jgi:putative ABC transport system permease protein
MMLERWAHDLRLAVRSLLRARGFTVTAVLTLALGVGGATVMFALVEGVLLRPMPVRDQDRLVVGWKELPSLAHWPLDRRTIEALGAGSAFIERVAGVDYNGAQPGTMAEDGTAFSITSANVTGDFFPVLGVDPLLGRALHRADDVLGAENVLVITCDLWQRRYGGAPDVIGRRLMAGEHAFRIVGVMPPDFAYPRGVEAWTTVTASAATLSNPTFREAVERELDLVARLRPGATLEQARQEMQGRIAALEAEAAPGGPGDSRVVVRSLTDVVVGEVRTPMVVLFAAVALVLLIATVNVANLLLLRGEGRREELAVRAALGAAPVRLAHQVLAEGLVLGVAAAVAGLCGAWWALPAVGALVPGGLPRVEAVDIDPAAILFAFAAGLFASALAAVVPALRSMRVDMMSQLRGGQQVGHDRGVPGGRGALVVAQVALAVTIVAAAGLLARNLLRLESVDMGLAADRLVLAGLSLPEPRYADPDRHRRFLEDVVEKLEATPGIAGATPVNTRPFSGTGGWDVGVFTALGQGREEVRANPSMSFEAVHPNYFATLDVAIVRGRAFSDADRAGAPEVVIVTDDMAVRVWPGQDPIGKRLKFGGPDSEDPWRTVVGVARPTRYRELVDPRPTLYVPAEQLFVSARIIVVRTASPRARVAGLLRERVAAVDPDAQVTWVASFEDMAARPLARPRFNARLIGLFAAVALLLATVGVYAVMGTHVRQRSVDLGIRVALGATPTDLRRLVLGEGLRLAGRGAAIGLAGAVGTTPVLRGLLFDLGPLDPVSLLGAALLLVLASALASYLPARRAARTDPLAALRAM